MDKDTIVGSQAIQNLLSQYNRYQTIRQHKIQLTRFFTYIDKHPDEYIKDLRIVPNGQKVQLLDQYQKDITKYRQWLIQQDYAPKTIHNAVNSVKVLMDDGYAEIGNVWWRKLGGRGTEATAEAITDTQTPTPTELKLILTNASTKYRAFYLIQSSSGMRLSEVANLTLDDIELQHECPRITLRQAKVKTKTKGTTRITPEAKTALQMWLNVREETKDKRIFQVESKSARKAWNLMLKKAGFDETDTHTKRRTRKMSPHSLRRYFKTQFSKYNPYLAQYFMNQTTNLDKTYTSLTHDELDRMYAEGMQHLFVFDHQPSDLVEVNQEISELRQNNQQKDQQLTEMQTQLNNLRLELLELRMAEGKKLETKKQ